MATFDGTSVGTTPGVKATSPAGANIPAVQGLSSANANGVYGQSAAQYYGACAGLNTANTGYGYYGEASGTSGRGIFGYASGTSGIGVYGAAANQSAIGVYGWASGFGSAGVYATASGNSSRAVYALAGNNAVAILAYGFSSLSDTDVTGTLSADYVSKLGGSFLIDHPAAPEEKYLEHSFVESPERKNVYDGVATADAKGEFTVDLPSYFELLNTDFRYQLTPIGGPAPGLFVKEEVKKNKFSVGGAAPGQRVCWQVTGSRQDEWAKANPLVPERDKPAKFKGTYLAPAAHKQPAEKRQNYIKRDPPVDLDQEHFAAHGRKAPSAP